MSRPVLLLTGFEPFDGEAVNPSWEVARALHGRQVAGWRLCAARLPCAFATALPALHAALDRWQPAAVIALGLAGSRSAVSVERVAVNLVDARIPDNAGAQPVDVPVQAGGAPALFTGLPAELSLSAGSFVCNQVFYGLMAALAARPGVRGGFIHLPPLPAQAARHPQARPLALDAQVQALRLAAAVVASGAAELAVPGGRVD